MTSRFDLEQNIFNCWNIVDDINLINTALQHQDISRDDVSNYLTGMSKLYQLKFEVLFDSFEKSLKQT